MIGVLLLYMFLASTFVIGKAALVYSQPIFLIGTRMTIGGILLLLFVRFFHKDQWKFKKEDFWLFAQIAFFHIYVSFILEFWSYKYVTASKAAFMFNLSPFITAIFAYVFFREAMSLKKWIGLIIGFLGSLPVLFGKESSTEMATKHIFGVLSIPELCLLIAATAGVYGWIVMKKLVVNKNYSPIFVNGIGMFFGGVAALLTSFGFEEKPLLKNTLCQTISDPVNTNISSSWFGCCLPDFFVFLGYVFLLILVANIIFYNFYGFLLKKYTPTFLSLVGLLCPLFAACLGWLFLGETVTWTFFVSLAVIMLGAYIFYKDELQQQGLVVE
jgi:drug/metabolite transporter (DMT)-like permease